GQVTGVVDLAPDRWVAIAEHVRDVVAEERGVGRLRTGAAGVQGRVRAVQHDGRRRGREIGGVRDVVQLPHSLQNRIATVFGRAGMGHRVVEGRVLDDAGQQCCLRQGQLRRVLAEIDLRRYLDAPGVVGEVGDVEV